jgi:hypothetical protein
MARRGLGLPTIATLIGRALDLTPAQFAALLREDDRIFEAVEYGRAAGTEIIAGSIVAAAKGGDVSASKFYLERVGHGGSWARANTPAAVVTVYAAPAQIDQDAMAARFQRQRQLLDGTCRELLDGTCRELLEIEGKT